MSDEKTQRTIHSVPVHGEQRVEPEWKIAFRDAKREAEDELQAIHREAAKRAREHLRRAS